MSDLFSLKGRIALVTGASRGLGRDFALCLAEAGATVLCAGRTVKQLEATVKAIQKKKGKAEIVALDVNNEEKVRATIRAMIRKHKRIDILINNAGIVHRANVVDTDTKDFRGTVETDLIAPFVLAREVGRHMLARRYGRIVNISSALGVMGRATVASYVASKHGIIGLTKTLAAEFGPHVTVNAIAPGYIRTEFNVPLQKNKDFSKMVETRTAAQRWGDAQDLRGTLLLLASDAGSYLTATTIVVDGGLTANL
jgi:NAD(P)-dependent dehydrogenase (short-subunit alcohol dehydrogenase family)